MKSTKRKTQQLVSKKRTEPKSQRELATDLSQVFDDYRARAIDIDECEALANVGGKIISIWKVEHQQKQLDFVISRGRLQLDTPAITQES